MSQTVIACPGCQSPLAITPELLGRTIACPACQTLISLASSAAPVDPQHSSSLPQIQRGAATGRSPGPFAPAQVERDPTAHDRSRPRPSGFSPFIIATWGLVAVMLIAAGVLIALRIGGSGQREVAVAPAPKKQPPENSGSELPAEIPSKKPSQRDPEVPKGEVPVPSPMQQRDGSNPGEVNATHQVQPPTSNPASAPAVPSQASVDRQPQPPAPQTSQLQSPPAQSVTLTPANGGLPGMPRPPASPPVGALAGFEAAWKLPTLLSTQEERLATLASPPREPLTLSISSTAADLPGTAAIFAEADAGGAAWSVQYVAGLDAQAQTTQLGTIRLADRELRFAWANPLPDAAIAKQLANCLVEVRHGRDMHVAQLRQPAALGACQLDLDENVQTVDLQMSDPPKLDRLRLEIRELVNFPSGARLRNDVRALEIGKRAFIEFADFPGAETSIQFNKLGTTGLVLRLESEFKENAASKYDLSFSRLEGLEEGMTKALASAQRELPAEQARLAGLQSQLSTAASTRATSLPEQTALQRAVSGLQGQVKRAASRISALQKQIAESQARLAAVPNIRSFLESLHERAELRYAIVAECGDRDLVLVDGTGSAVGAE